MFAGRRLVTVGAVCLAAVLGALGTWLLVDGAEEPRPPGVGRVGERGHASSAVSLRQYPPSSMGRHAGHRGGRKGVPDRLIGPILRPSRPVALRIPRLAVSSPLVELRLDSSGAMEVPPEPALAGWFALGPAPGAIGPAVIAGHVTWNGAPGIFHGLARLRAGDTVAVSRRDGRTAVFSVTGVAQYPKDAFPTRAVYGATDHAALRLITCAGGYDAVHHRYLDNVVVFARLVAVRPAPR